MLEMKIYGHRNLPYLSYDLLFVHRHADGRTAFGRPLEILFDLTTNKHEVRDPTLRVELEAAQDLFQQMWNDGFRPADGSSGKAEVDALKGHIKFAERIALAYVMPTIATIEASTR